MAFSAVVGVLDASLAFVDIGGLGLRRVGSKDGKYVTPFCMPFMSSATAARGDKPIIVLSLSTVGEEAAADLGTLNPKPMPPFAPGRKNIPAG